MASRQDTVKADADNPGPGAYSIAGKSGEAAPRYSMAGRHEGKDLDAVPGPGAYNKQSVFDENRKAKAGASMKSRNQTSNIENVPGPGAYQPSKAVRVLCKFDARCCVSFVLNLLCFRTAGSRVCTRIHNARKDRPKVEQRLRARSWSI